MDEPFLSERYRLDGVVTAVDVTHALDQLGAHNEAVRQVAMADRLLLTKCDLASAEQRAAVAAGIARLNPGARRVEVAGGAVAADAVFGCGLYDPPGKLPDVAAWLGEEAVRAARQAPAAPVWSRARVQKSAPTHSAGAPAEAESESAESAASAAPARHDAGVTSFVLRFDEPLDWFGFSDGLTLLLQVYGGRILRIKGLLNVAGDPLPRVLQCVQHSVYPASSLPAWPAQPPYDDRRSRLVFIVRDLAQDEVVSILGSFAGQVPQVGD